jgi:predicted ATPase
VLDNFEHLIEAAPVLADLVRDGLESKWLVTSRIPLRLSAERTFPVSPLALPNRARLPDPNAIRTYDAVVLFAERARAAQPSFVITDANAPTVADLCIRLDGLPLAIELAAARMNVLTPQALNARLAYRLDLLAGGARDLPDRQQTLRATIDWSHNLLSSEEQALFARLAVFHGGCTLDAAEAVCGGDVIDGLTALIDGNLLRQEAQPDGQPRYTMLETIRAYALEQLVASGEADELSRRHARYFASVEDREAVDHRSGEPNWLALEQDIDNFRAALSNLAALNEHASFVHLVFSLRHLWYIRGHLDEGARWSEMAVELAGDAPPPLQARAWECAASFELWRLADEARSEQLFRQALDIYRDVGDEVAAAWILHELGWLAIKRDMDEAVALHVEATATFRRLKAKELLTIAIHNHGLVELLRLNHPKARELLEESLILARELDSKQWISNALVDLGLLALIEHRHEDAAPLFVESLDLSIRLGWRVNVVCSLRGIAALTAVRGEFEPAARTLGAADAIEDATGQRLEPYEYAAFAEPVALLMERASEPLLAAAFTQGKAMSEPEAAAYAIATITEPSRTAGNLIETPR